MKRLLGTNIGHWNYKSDAFGIVDEDMKHLLPILKILTHTTEK